MQAAHRVLGGGWATPLADRLWSVLTHADPSVRLAQQTAVVLWSDAHLERGSVDAALNDLVRRFPDLGGRIDLDGRALVTGSDPVVARTVRVADDAAAQAAVEEYLATPVAVASGPVTSALLVVMPTRSALVLVVHQLACDGASLVTVVDHLASAYESRVTGTPRVNGVPIVESARDFWDRTASGARAEQLVDQIRDVPLDMPLPGLRPRTGGPRTAYGCHTVQLERELSDRVQVLARALGARTETVYLSAFRTLLHRIARHEPTLVMARVDRRPVGGEPGCWTDLVPLPAVGHEQLRFVDFVAATGRLVDAASSTAPASFTDLAGRLGHDLGVGPGLGRVAFGTRPVDRLLPVAGGTWMCRSLDTPATEFDLDVMVQDDPAGVVVQLCHDPSTVPTWSVETLARSFTQLLRSATTDPGEAITALDIVDPEDRAVLDRWNGLPDIEPVTEPVPRILERIATEHRDREAVVDGDRVLTYGDLDGWANRLARALVSAGVAKGDVVGLYLPRSAEWVVGYLAAYKIGAVPMALDPRAPRARLDAAVAAAPPRAVVVPRELPPGTPLEEITVVRVAVDSDAVTAQSPTPLGVEVELDDLAYIVQTSGSTGSPRAVLGVHRSHAHLSVEVAAVMRIGEGSRTSWLVDAAAGISMSLVWRALCAGATLCIASDEELASPLRLRDWHLRHRVTHTFVTTQLAESLTALEWPADGPLRVMEIGGEKVRHWPSAELPFDAVVAYGSNEAFLVTSMLFPWEQRVTARTAAADDLRSPPPVGRPLPGVRVYAVDADLQLLPPGAVGDICVDSPELMLGYLGDADETARKVVPNPFGSAGSRLLRTGDVGAVRPDGLVELAGRTDDMVKVRGYRVEPAAVEAILTEHPAVTACAVVSVADAAGHQQLVACIEADEPATPEELRAHMLANAPSYMVPIAYVPVDRLPRGLLNKVDRKQLPPADWMSFRPRAEYRAPASREEEVLVRIWAEVLDDNRVGADDNLLDMGGSSLHIGRVQVRVLEQLGVEVNARQIFETPTPAGVAALVLTARAQPGGRETLPPVRSRRSGGPSPAAT